MRGADAVIEPARILVVDDDVKLLRLLAIRLRRAGWLIETAESGRQALAAIPRFRPQVVVTDVRMGGMDGMALFEALHSQHPTLPVIILTAHEKRRFVPRVDFVTSPAWLGGDGARRRAGLLFGGVSRVVTTLGVFGFDLQTRRMRIEATHPGVTKDQIREHTGFPLGEAEHVTVTEPPSDDELAMLRALDPERRFLG